MKLCWAAVIMLLALLVGTALGYPDTDETLWSLRRRIEGLGDKSTQLLTFLSFAIAAVVFLGYGSDSDHGSHQVAQKIVQSGAMQWWISAIFPVLAGVFPVKEFRRDNKRWCRIVRWAKFALLWVALGCIVVGAVKFYLGLS